MCGLHSLHPLHAACRQPPKQPAINCAERQIASIGFSAGARCIVQNPGNLCRGKIGVQHEAGFLSHFRLMARLGEAAALACSTPVLPDDCVSDGAARCTLPNHHGFPLIGQANRDWLLPQAGEHSADTMLCFQPDFLSVMFDPTRLRVDLRKLTLALTDNRTGQVKSEGAG